MADDVRLSVVALFLVLATQPRTQCWFLLTMMWQVVRISPSGMDLQFKAKGESGESMS